MLRALLLLALSATAASTSRCETFCTRALGLCKAEDAAYDSMKECLDACPKWDADTAPDIIGDNTLGCREFWLDRVENTMKQVGKLPPGLCDYIAEGGGLCDPSVPYNCDAYCGQLGAEGDCGQGPWNAEEEECNTACEQFPRGTKDSIRGNSLECRILYVNIGEQSSMPGAKGKYCPHSGIKSDMCTAPADGHHACDDYCEFNKDFCGSTETTEECSQYCRALDKDALKCHMKYVAVAGRCTEEDVPCAHRAACAAKDPMAVFAAVAIPDRSKQGSGAPSDDENENENENDVESEPRDDM
eukprot:TRINITY_DN6067_c0_g2_i1.p1 TRINITY_DN6067_c0_g2~~TRINITY_DN6067_c0_g2_i1.p1  ORF type:complete len:301 (-),score=57.45 TRINITY_DN6067_c0_g2_i1:190-1092(-)